MLPFRLAAANLGRGRLLRLFAVAVGLTLFCRLGASDAETAVTDARSIPDVITTGTEFWNTWHVDKTTPRRMRMDVTVYYYDPTWKLMWGETKGQPVYLPTPVLLPISSSQRVLIEGEVVPGDGLSPQRLTFTVLDPKPKREVMSGVGRVGDFLDLNGHYVSLEGYLNKQTDTIRDHLVLEMVVEGRRVFARMWTREPKKISELEDAKLRVTGVYISKHNSQTDALELDLWVASPEDIEIIGSLGTDTQFDLPLTPIETLPDVPARSLVRVAGRVRSFEAGQKLKLRDDTGEIVVKSAQTRPVRIGDTIEAVGRSFAGGMEWILSDALYRPTLIAATNSAATSADGKTKPLRLIDQVLMLGPDEAAKEHPVRLTGTITWSEANTRQAFLHDTSGGIRIELPPGDYAIPDSGSMMTVNGTSASGAYAPTVVVKDFHRLGNVLPPEPKLVTLEQALTGIEEAELVEMRGFARDVTSDGNWTKITITTAAGNFTARVARDDTLTAVRGALVDVRGVCTAVPNARRQLVGVEIWVLTPADVRVEEAAPADLFAVPEKPISGLRQFSAMPALNHWVRVKGVVTHYVPGRYVFIEDGAEGLFALTEDTAPLVPGDEVEMAGLPGLEDQRLILREGSFRRTGHRPEPAPVELDPANAIDEELDSRFVRVTGTLINAISDSSHIDLKVQAGNVVFDALLDRTGGEGLGHAWSPGSRLALAGVYRIETDEGRRARGFQLQLRSADDVEVLEQPSWWTPQRAFMLAGAFGVIVILGFERMISLRRRVRNQTEQIREQLAKEANLEARNREIVANASDFIFIIDGDGSFTLFNPAGERMTGYSSEEAMRMNIRNIIIPAEAERTSDFWLNPGASGTVTFQSRLRCRDGRLIWVETSSRVIHEAGRATGVLGVVRDISERKQVELELERARDAAEANTQAKSAFLANMSHEIRTPMNGVIGMSNLLLETPLDRQQHEFAETIRNSAEALLTVLNDILDLSKIEAGKLQFETLDFDLGDTVEETLELLAARAAAKQLELAALIPHGLPRSLRGDPGRLRQVLLNLLGNAVKFTERGEVVVNVTLESETNSVAHLRFEISDTGIGLTEEAQGRLFKAFSQADNSTTRKFGGTGLGLAISKQIIELMGGAIGVRSAPGKGSTFWFTVPLQKQPDDSIRKGPADLGSLRGLRVLAVDDNATNRKIIQHYVGAWQMRCDVASDAREALMRAIEAAGAGDPYRLALLDFDMPGMDGVALAESIRCESQLRTMPMILLTSLDRRFSPDELTTRGFSATLTKPMRQQDLLAAILRTIGESEAQLRVTRRPSSSASADAASKQDASAPLPAMRILVAEDNVVNQRLIQLQLRKLGQNAEIAGNGLEVLEALDRAEFDVVLMDCQMPEMDGYETTQRIRRHPRHSRVRVIAMTANAMQGDRDKCLAAGMDDYLSKPTRVEDLRSALSRSVEAAATTDKQAL